MDSSMDPLSGLISDLLDGSMDPSGVVASIPLVPLKVSMEWSSDFFAAKDLDSVGALIKMTVLEYRYLEASHLLVLSASSKTSGVASTWGLCFSNAPCGSIK